MALRMQYDRSWNERDHEDLQSKLLFPASFVRVDIDSGADSLKLENGSLINGKFFSGTGSEISFQVGSSVRKFSHP